MSDEEKKVEKITSFSLLAFVKPKEKISIRDKTVYLYDLSSDALEKLSKILKGKEDYEIRFRKVLPLISSLNEIKDVKEKREPLPADFIDQLTQAELEQIALKYTNIPSINILSIQKEDADDEIITQKENEPVIHYLDRLLIEKDKRAHSAVNRLRKLVESSNLLGASIDKYQGLVASSILSSSGKIDEVSATWKNYKKPFEKLQPIQFEASQRLFDSHLKDIANKKREREEELNLYQLTSEMTERSASLLKELSSTAGTFLLEFDKRSKKTDGDTRKQIRIALGALTATVFFSAASLCYTALGYYRNAESNINEAQWQNKLHEFMELQRIETTRNLKMQQEIVDRQIKLDEKPIIRPRKKPQ